MEAETRIKELEEMLQTALYVIDEQYKILDMLKTDVKLLTRSTGEMIETIHKNIFEPMKQLLGPEKWAQIEQQAKEKLQQRSTSD